MKVYPKPGLLIRDPVTMQHIPTDGHEVSENDMHWAMLLNHGDVTKEPPKGVEVAALPDDSTSSLDAQLPDALDGGSQ